MPKPTQPNPREAEIRQQAAERFERKSDENLYEERTSWPKARLIERERNNGRWWKA